MVRQSRTPFGSPFLTETFARPLVSARRESHTHYCSFLTESFSSSCSFVSRKVRTYRLLLFQHFHINRVLDNFTSSSVPGIESLFLTCCECFGSFIGDGGGRAAQSAPLYFKEYSLNSNQTYMRCNTFKIL